MERGEIGRENHAPGEVLGFLRRILDKRRVGSTPEHRIIGVMEYCMSDPLPTDDPAFQIQDYFPAGDALHKWYIDNRLTIDALRREDKTEYFTDRYDLEEASEPFIDSVWMQNILTAHRMLPYDPEIANAEVALKLLYQISWYEYEHAPQPPQSPLRAA